MIEYKMKCENMMLGRNDDVLMLICDFDEFGNRLNLIINYSRKTYMFNHSWIGFFGKVIEGEVEGRIRDKLNWCIEEGYKECWKVKRRDNI